MADTTLVSLAPVRLPSGEIITVPAGPTGPLMGFAAAIARLRENAYCDLREAVTSSLVDWGRVDIVIEPRDGDMLLITVRRCRDWCADPFCGLLSVERYRSLANELPDLLPRI
jgi:hypothetical protein